MGKRSDFARRPMDKYLTFDPNAYPPLLKFLPPQTRYWEPCAGEGHVEKNLTQHGHQCVVATDIASPAYDGIYRCDALGVTRDDVDAIGITHIITNPPWTRPILHEMIEHFARIRPTWLLFDADWICTKQTAMAQRHGLMTAPELRQYCHLIVPVGRIKWIEGSKTAGKDNCCWYLFDFTRPGRCEVAG